MPVCTLNYARWNRYGPRDFGWGISSKAIVYHQGDHYVMFMLSMLRFQNQAPLANATEPDGKTKGKPDVTGVGSETLIFNLATCKNSK